MPLRHLIFLEVTIKMEVMERSSKLLETWSTSTSSSSTTKESPATTPIENFLFHPKELSTEHQSRKLLTEAFLLKNWWLASLFCQAMPSTRDLLLRPTLELGPLRRMTLLGGTLELDIGSTLRVLTARPLDKPQVLCFPSAPEEPVYDDMPSLYFLILSFLTIFNNIFLNVSISQMTFCDLIDWTLLIIDQKSFIL